MLLALLGALVSPLALALYLGTFVLLYIYMTKDFDYWKKKGVPGPKPHFPFGNSFGPMMQKKPFHEFSVDWYHKSGKKYCGLFEFKKPMIMVGDLELLKRILIKDFDHFVNRRTFDIRDSEPELAYMLSILEDQEWKDVRSVMSPTFTSGKMKAMFPLIVETSETLVKSMKEKLKDQTELEMKDIFSYFTVETIGSVAFGVESTSKEFIENGSELTKPATAWRMFQMMIAVIFPKLGKKLGLRLFSPEAMRFFANIVRSTIEHRDKNNIRRNDFLQLMMEARHSDDDDAKDGTKHKKRTLSDELIISNCILFFFGGFETSSLALSFAVYLLAVNPDIQEKLVLEIENVLEQHDGKVTYESVQEMHYLDMVISETLRMFPGIPIVDRVATKNYHIPGTDIVIPKGMIVTIPIYAIHHDPEIYPDPEKFDPERFTPENKANRELTAWMPFGQGPRNCIAVRFALMETKIALAIVLRNFIFSPGPHTDIPLKFDKRAVQNLKSESGIQLNVTKRTK